MTEDEIDRWEVAYAEVAARDFARKLYEECDKEDEEVDRDKTGAKHSG